MNHFYLHKNLHFAPQQHLGAGEMNHSDGCERETRESGDVCCDAILLLFDSDYFYSVTFLDVDCRGVLPPFASPPIPVFLDLSWAEFISCVLHCGFP